MSQQLIGAFAAAMLIVGGGAFYGGTRYQAAKAPLAGRFMGAPGQGGNGMAFQGRRAGQAGGFMMGGPNGAAGFLAGDVLAKDANSLTLRLRDGGSKIVFFASSTRISKMADGSLADIASGTMVTVNGTANQDGSVTAELIQVRPAR